MRKKNIAFAATIITLLLMLGGCNQLGVDIQDRLSMFVSELNATNRSTINAQFDQSLTQDLPLMTATWWNTNFPLPLDSDHLYGITLLDYSDPTNVVATISGPPAFNMDTGLPRNAVFVMSKEGIDWFIEQLYLDGSSTALIR
jgi:hypothetical protein